MKANELEKALSDILEEKGYRSIMVKADRFFEAREAVENFREGGDLDARLYTEYLSDFDNEPSAVLPDVQSLIVVGMFQRRTRVTFEYHEREYPVIIPPTYIHDEDRVVLDRIDGLLNPAGYRTATASAPQKRLAVCGGLARYGRNNIAYIEGFGSFHRLLTYYTDLPCEDESWGAPRMMDRCTECDACRKACPSGAIRDDRFLVRADKCLTFHNEMAWPFEDWIDPAWHHCLVGCMKCQKVCPENAPFLKRMDEGARFSDRETALILEKQALEELPEATYKKIQRWGMAWTPNVLPRNLEVLMR